MNIEVTGASKSAIFAVEQVGGKITLPEPSKVLLKAREKSAKLKEKKAKRKGNLENVSSNASANDDNKNNSNNNNNKDDNYDNNNNNNRAGFHRRSVRCPCVPFNPIIRLIPPPTSGGPPYTYSNLWIEPYITSNRMY